MFCRKKTSTLANVVCIPQPLDQGRLLAKHTAELKRKSTSFFMNFGTILLLCEVTMVVIGPLQRFWETSHESNVCRMLELAESGHATGFACTRVKPKMRKACSATRGSRHSLVSAASTVEQVFSESK